MLVGAERPVIIADRMARSQEGVKRLIELAEALNAPVLDLGGRETLVATLGELAADGYPPESVNGRVARRLEELALSLKRFSGPHQELS